MPARESSTTTAAPPKVAKGSRLRLRDPAGAENRSIDGGWWPRSSDFNVELPLLLEEIDATAYPTVWAVTYNLDSWDRPPHLIPTGGRRVRMGGFRAPFDKAMVSLVDGSGWSHVDLVVIPPDTAPGIAERTLTLAGDNDDRHRADDILRLGAADKPAVPEKAAAS